MLASLGLIAVSAAPAFARTQGYDITNATRETLTITSVEAFTTPRNEGAVFEEGKGKAPAPRVGFVLNPGAEMHVEIENPLTGADRTASIGFSNRYTVLLRPGLQRETVCVKGTNDPHQCQVEGRRHETITFAEPEGTKIVIDSNELANQRAALKNLCNAAHECVFVPEKEIETSTPRRLFGEPATACRQPIKTTLHGRENLAITDSVGFNLKFEVTIGKVFTSGIELKYNHDRTTEKEVGQDIEVPIPAYTTAWVAGTAPVIRDYGTFTLRLGQTEWEIKNVYFDSPDPNTEHHGHYVADEHALNQAEKEALCTGKEPTAGPVATSPATVQASSAGTNGADPLRGFSESNTIRGLGGDDVIMGGSGHDTLYGGGGDDTINGGPGEDTLYGGPGADRITDRSGPTVVHAGGNSGPGNDVVDVREGKGDDVVHCETINTVVIADPGDEIDGTCGKVILGTQVIGN
ncbi:MAG TPA: hypothetical protein VGC32_07110 [Solirubrobacterales bacterium]